MRALITPTLRRASLLTVGLLVFGLILAACGGSSSTTGAATSTATTAAATATTASASPTVGGTQASVRMTGSIGSFGFSPASITIKVGTAVVWTNSTGAPHTSSSDAGSAVTWDSGLINPGGTFSFTFTQVGTFHYHCNVHPYMHGTIVVTS